MTRIRYTHKNNNLTSPAFLTLNGTLIYYEVLSQIPYVLHKHEHIDTEFKTTKVVIKNIQHAKKFIRKDLINEGIIFTPEVRQRKQK